MGELSGSDEQRASEIVGAELSALVKKHDDQSEDGMYDFDVNLQGGQRIALEVTRITDQQRRGQGAALDKHKWGDLRTDERLEYEWHLWLRDPNSNVKKAFAGVAPQLAALESQRVYAFTASDSWRMPIVRALVEDLGIGGGFVVDNAHRQPGFTISPPGGGTICGDLDLVSAVEQVAWLPDIRQKFERAKDGYERHLFVWLDISRYGAWAALDKRRLPDRNPKLPPEVTHIWVAAQRLGAPPGSTEIARFDLAEGWRTNTR